MLEVEESVLEIEKGYVWEIVRGTGGLWLAAISGSLPVGRFLRLSSELGQEAGDKPGGAREE